jgi:hypothetical protein
VAVVLSSETQLNRRGLLKLMLRIPEFRARLQELGATNADFLSLCGAFEDASSTLDHLRRDHARYDETAISEYEELCDDIESEIKSICTRL